MRRVLVLTRPVEAAPSRARWTKALRPLGLRIERLAEIPARKEDPGLTRRQVDVLRGMAAGLRTREIALQLRVGIKTVETHRQMLMKRLNIRHIPGLVRYALKTGVLPVSWLLD